MPLHMPPGFADVQRDCAALLEALRDEDTEAARVILDSGDTRTMAQLLAAHAIGLALDITHGRTGLWGDHGEFDMDFWIHSFRAGADSLDEQQAAEERGENGDGRQN